MPPTSFPTPSLLLRLWVVALLGAAALVASYAVRVPRVAATEVVYVEVTPTPYRCANGDVLGSSAACPIAVISVGPTATPDPFSVVAQEAGGREFSVRRGWSYGDVALLIPLWLLVFVAALHTLRRFWVG